MFASALRTLSQTFGFGLLLGSFAVAADLSITSPASLPPATAGTLYAFQFNATGGVAPYVWRLGLGETTYFVIDSAGVFSGVPRVEDAGKTLQIRIRVTDAVDHQVTQVFSLSITSAQTALAITTGSPLPNGIAGADYTAAFEASGGTAPFHWSVATGTLPAGLSLDAATGTLRGRPSSTGDFGFTIEVTDSSGARARKTFQLTITAADANLVITTPSPLPNAVTGTLYHQTIAAAGGQPPYRWRFPLGETVGFLLIDGVTGVLSGTPTDSFAGQTMDFRVMVTDSAGQVAIKTLRLLITGKTSQPLKITTYSPLPGAFVGLFYTATIQASGGAQPYRWAVVDESALPAGITIDLSSGIVYGVPNTEGAYRFAVQVRDIAGASDQQVFQLTVTANRDVIPAGPMPPVASPVFVLTDPGSSRAYFINRGMFDVYLGGGGAVASNAVSVYDIASGKLSRTIFVGRAAAGDDQGAALDPARHHLWVPNADDNTISLIDTSKGAVVDVISVGNAPAGAALDPTSGAVYVTSQQDNSISILDAAGNPAGTVSLDGRPHSIAFDPVTHRVFVAVAAQPWKIVAFEGLTRTAEVVLGNARSIHGIAIDAGTRLYAADASGQVYVINLRGSQPVLETSFTAGHAPVGIAVDSTTHNIYVTDFDTARVECFTPDGRRLTSFEVTRGPVALAIDPGGRKAYVADFLANGYSIIDLDKQTVQTSMPVGGIITGLAYDRAKNRIYGANLTANAVTVVDAAARKPLTAWRTGDFPWSIAVDPQLNQLYTVDVNDNELMVLSTEDGSVRKRIAFSEPKTDAAVVVVNQRNGRVFASQGTGSQRTVIVVDGYTNSILRTVDVGDRPIGIAIDEDHSLAYVGCRNSGTIVALDAATGDILARWTQPDAPYMLAVDPDYFQLYITVPPNKPGDFAGLLVLDSLTGEILKRIQLGSNPEAVVVDRPTGHVFVSDPTDGTVSVIDGYSLRITKVLPAGNLAFAMTVDPDNRLVYLANGTDGTINVIQDSASLNDPAGPFTAADESRQERRRPHVR
jgi:YVTN family beta-propeller protein